MHTGKKIYDKITKFIKLSAIWVIKILFAPRHFKVNIFKSTWYAICGGFMPDQVALYNLNMKNRREYLSEFDWYKSRYINEPYNFILNNKLVCTDMLKQYIKVAEIFVVKQKGKLTSADNKVKSYEDIVKEIKERGYAFIKPNNMGKGSGVLRFTYENETLYIDEKEVTEQELLELLKKRNDYHICEGIKQSKYLNKLYDKTTNTIRMVTLRNPETNEFEVYSAVQRIGTKETIPVDNGSRGGLTAKIDIETGVLTSAKCIQRTVDFDKHPDSNNPIKGVKIPKWDSIKKEMLDLANKFPYLYFVAWDILLTDEGICIIEANTSSGVNILQLWGGERKKGLGNFYRAHKIIKK
jgi:hypothetical protein